MAAAERQPEPVARVAQVGDRWSWRGWTAWRWLALVVAGAGCLVVEYVVIIGIYSKYGSSCSEPADPALVVVGQRAVAGLVAWSALPWVVAVAVAVARRRVRVALAGVVCVGLPVVEFVLGLSIEAWSMWGFCF